MNVCDAAFERMRVMIHSTVATAAVFLPFGNPHAKDEPGMRSQPS